MHFYSSIPRREARAAIAAAAFRRYKAALRNKNRVFA
jgi:hypothetical protein